MTTTAIHDVDDTTTTTAATTTAATTIIITTPTTAAQSNQSINSHPPTTTGSITINSLPSTPSTPPAPPIAAPLQPSYQHLLDLCSEQAVYFQDDHTEKGQRLYTSFIAWQDFIRLAHNLALKIDEFSYKYDFDENTPANGYRSFVAVTNACIAHGLNVCKNLLATRATIFFRKKFYVKEVEASSQLLSSICTVLQYLLILHEWSSDSGDLFGNGTHTAEELFELGDTINQYCFYGRCLGFQYGDSIRGVLRFISISMAGFSESYYAHETDGPLVKTTRSVWTGGKYFLNPELRARRIVNISQNARIDFCKSFWFLAESELMHMIPSIVGTSIKVNRMIEIPAEPLQLPRAGKKTDNMSSSIDVNQNDNIEFVDIPVPSSHLGPGKPVSVRLLSYTRREGMLGEGGSYRGWRKLPKRSHSLLFHCHGGGFVAQSSKSHELYLRDWAVALDAPILSIDYSLAPEAPFPRALEEVFYAYCWALKNAQYLGTTAERIILAGDSAGANLSIGIALKCIELGVRIPDGIFLAYCPTLISFVPSPARMLCLMDPLLPFGFMMRCLRAYASPTPEILNANKKHVDEVAAIRNAGKQSHLHLNLREENSAASSRRTSAAKSPVSSLADNSKWDQMNFKEDMSHIINANDTGDEEESSDTFASASYHSQTVERTDLPSVEDENSSCVSFEEDSQPIVHYPIEISATTKTLKDSDSEHYIDRFLDKYLIDTNTVEAKEGDTVTLQNGFVVRNSLSPTIAKTASEDNLFIEAGKDVIALGTIQGRLNHAVNSISTTFNRYTQSCEIRGDQSPQHVQIQDLRNMDALIARSPSSEFGFNIPKDPYLSPYWASDEWLSQLPTTKILTLDMDPCLDDCVMFAKKLKSLGRPVTIEILKGLPHGFLNFTMLSNEAMEGSKRCIKLIKELMKKPTVAADYK